MIITIKNKRYRFDVSQFIVAMLIITTVAFIIGVLISLCINPEYFITTL